jgi:phosphatidylinositol alpha-mannosyltransferase
MPALLAEGMTWKDLRLRALHAAPVELRPGSRKSEPTAAELEL